jgi:hypothetical protein
MLRVAQLLLHRIGDHVIRCEGVAYAAFRENLEKAAASLSDSLTIPKTCCSRETPSANWKNTTGEPCKTSERAAVSYKAL